MLFYQISTFTIHGEISKTHTEIIKLKYQLRNEMKSLNYLIGHI